MKRGIANHPVRVSGDELENDARLCIEGLAEFGGLLFDRCTDEQFLTFLNRLGPIHRHPDSDQDGVTRITPDGRPAQVGGGFTTSPLGPHTDRSGMAVPPLILGTRVAHGDNQGGGTCTLTDMAAALSDPAIAAAAQRLQLVDAATGRTLPMIFEQPDGRVRMRYRDDTHWFVDGSVDDIECVRSRVRLMTYTFPCVESAGYIIVNDLFLHGRQKIVDPKRVVSRILVQTLEVDAVHLRPLIR